MSRQRTTTLLLATGALLTLTVVTLAHGQVASRAYAMVCGVDPDSARAFCEGRASAEISVDVNRSLGDREWTPDPERVTVELELRCWVLEPRSPGRAPEMVCRGATAGE